MTFYATAPMDFARSSLKKELPEAESPIFSVPKFALSIDTRSTETIEPIHLAILTPKSTQPIDITLKREK